MEKSTDEVLMAAACRGDVEAFGVLVRRYQNRVFTVALRLSRQRATAEDVAQQAFLQAWERRRSYDRRWRVSTWLYRIVMNLCVDEHRRRARAAAQSPGDSRGVGPAHHPHDVLEEREMRDRLNGALARLPAAQRKVLVLRYLDDLPYGEIGRVCGLPVNTVKSYLLRGKAALRPMLVEWRKEQ